MRTLDTLLTYTHFPGVLFQPLRHLSGWPRQIRLRAWVADVTEIARSIQRDARLLAPQGHPSFFKLVENLSRYQSFP